MKTDAYAAVINKRSSNLYYFSELVRVNLCNCERFKISLDVICRGLTSFEWVP